MGLFAHFLKTALEPISRKETQKQIIYLIHYFMKMKSVFALLLLACLLQGNISFSQTQTPYKLPDIYRFDYEVVQMLINNKNAADTSVMHFLYTKSGDYAAAIVGRKSSMKGNLVIVFTRDGNSIIFDEHKKNITVISVRKLISDLSGLAKWIRMDSLVANLQKKTDGKDFQSVKTGNTKEVGGYASEEYSVSDNKNDKASVWCTRVDFNTPGDYILGVGGVNILKMMSAHLTAHPLFQALTQTKTLITEIDFRDPANGNGMDMHTVSISQTPTMIPTAGYQVNNYSNMTLPEIFQAEMKKMNN